MLFRSSKTKNLGSRISKDDTHTTFPVTIKSGGQKIMFMPALNLLKMKMANLDNDAAENIIDMVHKISHHIEIETGKFSPYHVD